MATKKQSITSFLRETHEVLVARFTEGVELKVESLEFHPDLPEEYYHRRSSQKRFTTEPVPGTRAWSSLAGTESRGQTGMKFNQLIDQGIKWAREEPGHVVVDYRIGLAYTKNVVGTVFGYHCNLAIVTRIKS